MAEKKIQSFKLISSQMYSNNVQKLFDDSENIEGGKATKKIQQYQGSNPKEQKEDKSKFIKSLRF